MLPPKVALPTEVVDSTGVVAGVLSVRGRLTRHAAPALVVLLPAALATLDNA